MGNGYRQNDSPATHAEELKSSGIEYVNFNLPVATPEGGWDNENVAESLKPKGLDQQFGKGEPGTWTDHSQDDESRFNK